MAAVTISSDFGAFHQVTSQVNPTLRKMTCWKGILYLLGIPENLPRASVFLISWLQSPSSVSLEPKKIVTVSIVSPSVCYEVKGPDAMVFVF